MCSCRWRLPAEHDRAAGTDHNQHERRRPVRKESLQERTNAEFPGAQEGVAPGRGGSPVVGVQLERVRQSRIAAVGRTEAALAGVPGPASGAAALAGTALQRRRQPLPQLAFDPALAVALLANLRTRTVVPVCVFSGPDDAVPSAARAARSGAETTGRSGGYQVAGEEVGQSRRQSRGGARAEEDADAKSFQSEEAVADAVPDEETPQQRETPQEWRVLEQEGRVETILNGRVCYIL